YKTGSAKKYKKNEPFQQGRVVQHLIYLEMARLVLQKKFGGAQIDAFSYFFAGIRGGGRLMRFSPADLADGKGILRNICRVASSGTFLATNNKDDCANWAYQAVCRDVVFVASCSKVKLANPANTSLQPFRELRSKEDSE